MKRPQGYIQRHAKHIIHSLTPDHEAVKCLVAFGKYAAKILATIEWDTQHWKLQESFLVLPVPRWLQMLELMQTTMPVRGELPLILSGAHLKDIHIRSPALWAWIAVLLQYLLDHMSRQLYGGCFQPASDLVNTLICNINPWLPHRVRFGWNYVATHTTLWLDMRDQFTNKYLVEWEAQKLLMRSLNDLECNTEVVYRERPIKRENDKLMADSREAAAKELPPEQQAAHAERQARAMPRNLDVALVSSQAALYPNWVWALVTKPKGGDQPRRYRTPREEVSQKSTLEEEFDMDSVFNPLLGLSSQSSQPSGSQPNASPDTTMGAAGPKTLPHFSKTSPTIPPFDLALLGLPAPMSPITVGENTLLNLAPGCLLRARHCPESVVGREFWDADPVLTAQCCWYLQHPPRASH